MIPIKLIWHFDLLLFILTFHWPKKKQNYTNNNDFYRNSFGNSSVHLYSTIFFVSICIQSQLLFHVRLLLSIKALSASAPLCPSPHCLQVKEFLSSGLSAAAAASSKHLEVLAPLAAAAPLNKDDSYMLVWFYVTWQQVRGSDPHWKHHSFKPYSCEWI